MGVSPSKLIAEVRDGHFRSAANQGKLSDVQRILSAGKVHINSTDSCGRSSLVLASMSGRENIVKAILDAGADTRVTTRGIEWTALSYASRHGYATIVKLLLDHGADPNVRDNRGLTPLHLVAKGSNRTTGEDQAETCTLLLAGGAVLEATEFFDGSTPLLIAASTGSCHVLASLINGGAFLDSRDSRGATPLILASKNQHEQTVATLIVAGCDVECRDDSGRNALTYALSRSNGNVIVAKTLVEGGATKLLSVS